MANEPSAAAMLEGRRESTIVLDREGRFHHDGEPIRHPGVCRALHRWIELGGDGRYVLRAGSVWCYFRVEDAPFLVRRVRDVGMDLVIGLTDETEETLDYETLRLDADGVLRCRVKARRFPARFDRHAHYQLADRLEQDPEGGLWLPAGGERWAVIRDRLAAP